MTQNEKLRQLLEEVVRVGENLIDTLRETEEVRALITAHAKIEAALAEPVGTAPERSPLAPGEGTWSVFAMKVVQERDEARAEIERLDKRLGDKS